QKEEDLQLESVRAIGDIYANTWYELNMSVPLKIKTDILTGNRDVFYTLNVGQVNIPLQPFKEKKYKDKHDEHINNTFHIFRWKLPIELTKIISYEVEGKVIEQTKENAIKKAIEIAKEQVLLELGKDAEILSDFILHEA